MRADLNPARRETRQKNPPKGGPSCLPVERFGCGDTQHSIPAKWNVCSGDWGFARIVSCGGAQHPILAIDRESYSSIGGVACESAPESAPSGRKQQCIAGNRENRFEVGSRSAPVRTPFTKQIRSSNECVWEESDQVLGPCCHSHPPRIRVSRRTLSRLRWPYHCQSTGSQA